MFDTLRDNLRARLARQHQRPFLEAAMAASALVAAADGEVTFSESARVDEIARAIERLRAFDVHEAMDLFHDYVQAISADGEAGRARALEAVVRGAGDREARVLVVKACAAISGADGEFHPMERRRIVEICRALGVSPDELA